MNLPTILLFELEAYQSPNPVDCEVLSYGPTHTNLGSVIHKINPESSARREDAKCCCEEMLLTCSISDDIAWRGTSRRLDPGVDLKRRISLSDTKMYFGYLARDCVDG